MFSRYVGDAGVGRIVVEGYETTAIRIAERCG
jgi:hypothetical protein